MQKEKFSVHHIGQERKHLSGTGEKRWKDQCLGPRKGGLESLIQRKWQELSIKILRR